MAVVLVVRPYGLLGKPPASRVAGGRTGADPAKVPRLVGWASPRSCLLALVPLVTDRLH
jgi:hypothetical protein